VALVGVDATDDDVVLQDRLSGNIARDSAGVPITAADTCNTDDASCCDLGDLACASFL
jgi:hypothetical protein